MSRGSQLLPQWTWEDLEMALSHFGTAQEPARSTQRHLLQGVREQAPKLSATDLLKEVMSVAWIVGSLAASATGRPLPDGSPGSLAVADFQDSPRRRRLL